ncbi:uracil/xanthine transporter [Paenibacillus jamilae]|uniref:Uracil/xanthine transporter n=1 Tax=Paenibacillus jamilae TaxID=114136 RepID=A0ACC4ZP27_9BACL|nr:MULTISPECIES: uracil/xanthine transporter [Paenibacillus]AUO09015.1 uracil/xanthine transporter [Paenibacillus sp. lzh-N1]KTS77467.1 uracil/xanthine transporter [Paenibacillus jamilae]
MALFRVENWLAGLQWLFFLFTNTVVIPITVGAAFQLPSEKITYLIQTSFFLTGLACILQALLGHRRSIMEGQSGLWWGVILSLSYAAPSQGMSMGTLGGSLAVGIIISGFITIAIGLSGLSQLLSKLFNAGVMAVFMFLLGCRLNAIFFKGMLGIPFNTDTEILHIDLPVFLLSGVVCVLVIICSVKLPASLSKYSILMGIIVGWVLFALLFTSKQALNMTGKMEFISFPLGTPRLDAGVIITAVVAGIINTSNTFGALKGTDDLYKTRLSLKHYNNSFTISGIFVIASGFLGQVPYAPYVSSIGFLNQTQILSRIPFIIGGGLFMLMGLISPIGSLMSQLPLSVGSAVLFVTYMRLLHSSLQYFSKIQLTTINVYRLAAPLFIGIIIMTFPVSYFESLPAILRPLLSNGLLVGILLSLLLENIHSPKSLFKNLRLWRENNE